MFVHSLTSLAEAARAAAFLAVDVPHPDPKAPPGLDQYANVVLGYLKWGVLVAGVAGILICAGMIVIGRRHHNQMGTEGVIGSVWVIGGLSLASIATALVETFLH